MQPVAIENPYKEKRKLCILCKLNIEPDYKNVRLLSQFQSRYTGRIYEKHITGLCERKQKKVEQEIRKAQKAGKQQHFFLFNIICLHSLYIICYYISLHFCFRSNGFYD